MMTFDSSNQYGQWAEPEQEKETNDSGGGVSAPAPPKPEFPEAARYGILGKIARVIEPETEADPAAIFTHLLVAFGNYVGRKAFFQVGQTKHHTNLFACIIGRSSRARKGMSCDYVQELFKLVDAFYSTQFRGGLSTGEGLIWAVRDPIYKMQLNKKQNTWEKVMIDEGVSDKRLLIVESEFARPLRVMSKPSSTLSSVIRLAWDKGDLETMTRVETAKATNAHISFVGHSTEDELAREMAECEFFNGFANRFLWNAVDRAQLLPDGGNINLEALEQCTDELQQALNDADKVSQMTRDDDARVLWHDNYAKLTADHMGMFGAVVSRAEAQVTRIAMIFALSDGSATITHKHLEAAFAYWDYCERCAFKLFGHKLLDLKAQKILEALRKRPKEGMTRKEISEEIFSRNEKSDRIDTALQALAKSKLAYSKTEPSQGRNIERWFASLLSSFNS